MPSRGVGVPVPTHTLTDEAGQPLTDHRIETMTAAAVAEKQPASPKGKTREELKSYAIFVFAFIFHFLVCKAASKAEATARLPKSRQIYPQLLSDYADFVGNIK